MTVFSTVFTDILALFQDMSTYLLTNHLFLIGLVIFVIGACIGLVKRVIS